MDAVKIRTHVGNDGILKLEVPTHFANRDVDIMVVMQAVEIEAVDALGWPLGFFEQTYGSLVDDPIERPPQGEYEVRELIE
jgi:hypothetical protein